MHRVRTWSAWLCLLPMLFVGCHGVGFEQTRTPVEPSRHSNGMKVFPSPEPVVIAGGSRDRVAVQQSDPKRNVATNRSAVKPASATARATSKTEQRRSKPYDGLPRPSELPQLIDSTGLEARRTSVRKASSTTDVVPNPISRRALAPGSDTSRAPESEASAPRLMSNDDNPKSSTKTTHRIDLSTSLALVAGQNPQVGFVQERVREAWANVKAAEALWLPSLRAGVSYNKHEGNIQDVGGAIINVSRGSTFGGLGARAVGAGSPAVPGLYSQFHLADAIFKPIVAKRTMAARQHGVSATTNNEMLRAALAYTELVEAVERKRIASQTKAELKKLADLTASFAKRGQGNQADADRAKTELQLQDNVVTRADEAVRVASARLAEVLNLDTTETLIPAEAAVIPVDLVSADNDVNALVQQAHSNRPELCENQFEIDAAWNSYKRERYSPLVPNVGLGVSWGGYAGGVGDTIGNQRDRFDFDALVYWEVRNLGLGESAARTSAKSRMHQSQFRRAKLGAVIRREVATAYAGVGSAAKQIIQAEAGVKSANDSMTRNFKRIREGQGLPLEVLQSIKALDAAKRERLNARAAYNRAQFRLHRAIGWPDRQ